MNINLLKKHAKSFYWAGFFLSSKTFDKCSYLYNFCRTLDDIVDSNDTLKIKKKNFINFKKFSFLTSSFLSLSTISSKVLQKLYNEELLLNISFDKKKLAQ